MAWGKSSSADFVAQMVKRLEDNDPTLKALHIMSSRKLTEADFVKLARALGTNTTVLEFSASGHALSPAALTAFADALQTNKHMRHFCAGHQGLGNEGLALLEAGLAGSRLAVLDLEYKGISRGGAESVARICSGPHGAWEDIRLARNALCDASVSVFSPTMATLTTLTALDLRENALGAEACRFLGAVLASSSCPLQKLFLSRNTLTPAGAAHLAEAFRRRRGLGGDGAVGGEAAAVKDSADESGERSQGAEGAADSATTALDHGERMKGEGNSGAQLEGAAGADAASKVGGEEESRTTPNTPSLLEELVLESCGLGDDGARHLAEALVHLPRLHTLILDDCGITSAGAALLASHLPSAPALATLRLNGNADLGDEGAEALAGASARPDSVLRTLDVGKCGLTTAGLLHLIHASSSLESLVAFGNRLTPNLTLVEGADAATRAAGSRLVELDVGGNAMDESHASMLLSWLADSRALPRLRHLSLGGNLVPAATWHELSAAYRQDHPDVKLAF